MGKTTLLSGRTMNIKLFSFFSGLGFLDLGFEDEGFKIVYVNELYKPFLSAYKYTRRHLAIEAPDFGYCDRDITELLNGKDRGCLSDSVADCRRSGALVGFIGGPPCPDFSVGGKNRGQEGSGGRLSQIYADLICAIKPDFFLFENVKGLWRTSRHRTFYEGLKAIWRSNGYAITDILINTI